MDSWYFESELDNIIFGFSIMFFVGFVVSTLLLN